MPDVASILEIDELNVRKWGTQLLFLQSRTAAPPTMFFGESDHLPILPPGALQLGFVTTDGVGQEDSISNENTSMLQSLEPVRSDITGVDKSLTVAFGEDNAYVQALWHAVPFEEFPTGKHAPWLFDDGDITDYPEYRLGCIMQDGVGEQARYRYEYGYRAKVTAKTGRTMNRTDSESYGFTFGLYKDKSVGKSFTRTQNGPWYFRDAIAVADLDAGAITDIAVLDGGGGYDVAPSVVITGDGTGAAATATVSGGQVTAVTVDTAGTDYTTAEISFTRN